MEMAATEPTGTQLRRQIETEIHAGHANGTVRTAHTLAAMPSLQKLAEPWEGNNSTAYNFLDFGGADNDDWEEELDEGNIVGEEQQNHFEEAPTGNQALSMKHWSNVDFCTEHSNNMTMGKPPPPIRKGIGYGRNMIKVCKRSNRLRT